MAETINSLISWIIGSELSPGFWLGHVVTALIHAVLLLHIIAVGALFFIWLERKVSGRIQDRLGPTRVGGKFGWLQGLADGIKLLSKEDLMPDGADPLLFRICLLYTSPSPRDATLSRMPSSA